MADAITMASLERPAFRPASIGLVIATHRAERVIGQTLAAVAAQSRLPDRLIVVDDGSCDGTVAVARRWEQVLPLEVLALGVDQGIARARNVAVRRIDTDLVAFLDGVDLPLPDHLLTLADLHDRRPGVIAARALVWLPGLPPRRPRRRPDALHRPGRDQLRHLVRHHTVAVGSLMSRADLVEAHGFSEGDRSQDTTADWDLWLRLAAAGRTVSMPSAATVLARVRPGRVAEDRANRLRCEIRQLERVRRMLGSALTDEVDRAVADRKVELQLVRALTPTPGGAARGRSAIALARLAVEPGPARATHRGRAVAALVAPAASRRRAGRSSSGS